MKPDGGPAFPHIDIPAQFKSAPHMAPYIVQIKTDGGMTLRDYFAAAALQSFRLPSDYRDGMHNGAAAERAYLLADAMLAERAK